MKRKEIVAAARSFYNVPWMHQGRNNNGLDCVGLYISVARVLNYDLKGFDEAYRKNPTDSLLLNKMLIYNDEVADQTENDGDIVLIKFPRMEYPQHLGFLAKSIYEQTIVHVLNRTGISGVFEEPYKRWEKYTVKFFRFKGLEE